MGRTIRESCYAMARGELELPQYSGQCLKLVRLIVEDALYGGQRGLYGDYLVADSLLRTKGDRLSDPWASDLEASVVELGLTVDLQDRQPGDIVFNRLLGEPYGHVGILIERDMVIENTRASNRPKSIEVAPHLFLTPFEEFPVTAIARLNHPP